MIPDRERPRPDDEPLRIKATLCLYCGSVIEHTGVLDADGLRAIRDAMEAHDKQCAHNPLVAELATLRSDLLRANAERDEARARLSEMPTVECGCHPGVRWPNATWGQECPISKVERLLASREAALVAAHEALNGVLGGLLSHTTGGDPGMIFDADDAAVERTRRGHWKIDDRAIDKVRAALASAAPVDALRAWGERLFQATIEAVRPSCGCDHCDEMAPGWSRDPIIAALLPSETPAPGGNDAARG